MLVGFTLGTDFVKEAKEDNWLAVLLTAESDVGQRHSVEPTWLCELETYAAHTVTSDLTLTLDLRLVNSQGTQGQKTKNFSDTIQKFMVVPLMTSSLLNCTW